MKLLINILISLGFRYDLIQYRYFRKRIKGKYYKIHPIQLGISSYWTETYPSSTQTYILDTEHH